MTRVLLPASSDRVQSMSSILVADRYSTIGSSEPLGAATELDRHGKPARRRRSTPHERDTNVSPAAAEDILAVWGTRDPLLKHFRRGQRRRPRQEVLTDADRVSAPITGCKCPGAWIASGRRHVTEVAASHHVPRVPACGFAKSAF